MDQQLVDGGSGFVTYLLAGHGNLMATVKCECLCQPTAVIDFMQFAVCYTCIS